MAFFTAKVPVTIATGVICLALGGGLGALIMSYALGKPDQVAAGTAAKGDEEAKADPKAAGGDAKGGKGAGGGGKGAGGGGKGAGGGGQRGPSPKAQLAQLVAKLDVLTGQSLHVDLTPEQKKQTKDLLAGLAEKDAITDDEAKEKFDALVKLLDANKKTLENAGFRPGGAGGGGGPMGPPPANPFKEGEGAEHLKSLQATLSK
jgi:hypothetical protein